MNDNTLVYSLKKYEDESCGKGDDVSNFPDIET
jgi:hypothetical protein